MTAKLLIPHGARSRIQLRLQQQDKGSEQDSPPHWGKHSGILPVLQDGPHQAVIRKAPFQHYSIIWTYEGKIKAWRPSGWVQINSLHLIY